MVSKKPLVKRALDAQPDKADFRDRLYQPGLHEVPPTMPLMNYLKFKVPVLDQQAEGSCCGFGLATVANYLFRSRKASPVKTGSVSPRMLYEMAKVYDEYAGTAYEGSSARGAVKGWNKHGVCSEKLWPYSQKDPGELTTARSTDALLRPLGTYYRVNPNERGDMHAALAEVGVLYATASVHSGWDEVGSDGIIPSKNDDQGGHAFAIVGYDERGFWIQNSWGADWGRGGFCRLSYDDWLRDGSDVWVCRLGVPIAA